LNIFYKTKGSQVFSYSDQSTGQEAGIEYCRLFQKDTPYFTYADLQKTDGITNFQWQYWLDNFTWEGVLVISSSSLYGVSPADVYKTYLGTNKIIIDDEEGMIFDADKIKIYNDTVWQTTVSVPV
jgi:hypothetical protein